LPGLDLKMSSAFITGLISCSLLKHCCFRLRSGVPATVATTCLFTADACSEAVMTPYPCLSVQEQGKSDEVQNAVDLYLDAQEVLWVLDTGVVQTLDKDAETLRTGPPTVWAFDLNTRKVIVFFCPLTYPNTTSDTLNHCIYWPEPLAMNGLANVSHRLRSVKMGWIG